MPQGLGKPCLGTRGEGGSVAGAAGQRGCEPGPGFSQAAWQPCDRKTGSFWSHTQSAPRPGARSAPGAVDGDPASPREKIILVFQTSVQGPRKPSQEGRRPFSELEAPEAPATQSGRFLVPGFFRAPLGAPYARVSSQPGTQGLWSRPLCAQTGLSLTAVSTWASRLEPRNRPASSQRYKHTLDPHILQCTLALPHKPGLSPPGLVHPHRPAPSQPDTHGQACLHRTWLPRCI